MAGEAANHFFFVLVSDRMTSLLVDLTLFVVSMVGELVVEWCGTQIIRLWEHWMRGV